MAENIAITWRRIPERYRMEGSCCNTCSAKFFPPRKFCPSCRRKGKIESFKFSGKGRIHTFSEVHVPPSGYELEAPYVLAIIELEEGGGAMVTGQVVGISDADVKIGDNVEMIFRKILDDGQEGLLHYGYKFRLSK